MISYYIAATTFTHRLTCFCPDEAHDYFIELEEGDVLSIMEERPKKIEGDWYVVAELHNESFYLSMEELHTYTIRHLLISEMDLALERNYVSFCVDKAIDGKNEADFQLYSARLNHLNALYENLYTV